MAWYVVHVGKKLGVYSTWEEAHEQVNGLRVTAIRNTTAETKLCKPSMDIPLTILLFYNLSIHLMSTMMETMGASPCGLQFLKL